MRGHRCKYPFHTMKNRFQHVTFGKCEINFDNLFCVCGWVEAKFVLEFHISIFLTCEELVRFLFRCQE